MYIYIAFIYDVGVERSTQPSPKRYIELTFRIVRPCTSVYMLPLSGSSTKPNI